MGNNDFYLLIFHAPIKNSVAWNSTHENRNTRVVR